jgi:eukaryotic-like serine/threonine-protein kinase
MRTEIITTESPSTGTDQMTTICDEPSDGALVRDRDASFDRAGLARGSRVGDYEIIEELGSGGFSTVYRARHAGDGRIAAVKVLHPELAHSTEMVLRFLREAEAVNQIHHPNVVAIDDTGVLPTGQPFLVMECLSGADLETEVRLHGRATPRRVLEIVEPICEALHAAHRAGFVHRDVKAGNVFLARAAEREVVKLLDFGIAKLINPAPGELALTAMGRVIGTPRAMAPEQLLARPVGPATDVYAVGVLIFYLLVGRYPFEGEGVAELERAILDRPAPRPGDIVPDLAALDHVVGRCLEKWPHERYQSTAELLDDLRSAVTSGPPAEIARQTASAIYVDTRIASGRRDEEMLDAAADVLDRVETALTGAGYAIAVSTASSVLALRLDPAGLDESQARQQAARLAASVHADLTAIGGDAVQVALTLHAGRVLVSRRGPVCGSLLEVGTWAPWPGPGLFATDEALAGVDAPALARRPR